MRRRKNASRKTALISSLTSGDHRLISPGSSAAKSPSGPGRSSPPAWLWNRFDRFLETDVKIRLMENFRAIFYAPYYATHALGFYANEGVDVELVSSDAPGDAIAHLANGAIDLTWGGPMRVMTAHDRDDQSPLVCFGEVVSRDPFFLIGNFKGFGLSDLAHLRFATVSEVPTPWMCLQHDLREAGIDPVMITPSVRGRYNMPPAAAGRGE